MNNFCVMRDSRFYSIKMFSVFVSPDVFCRFTKKGEDDKVGLGWG